MKLKELNEAVLEVKAKKGLGLSLSKIKTYENCPYSYYLQYMVKEPYDKEDFNPKFFKIGQFAHKWIESKITNTACSFDSKTLSDEDKDKVMGNCAKVFDDPYITSLFDHGEVEKAFSMYITPSESDGLEARNTFIRDADFHGYIDYFAKIGDTLHLIDWKTGSKRGKDDDTFMQLFLYAKACQKLHGGSKFMLTYYYVDQKKPAVTRELTLAELDSKIEGVLNKATSIPTVANATSFPAKPSWACQYCPYSKMRSSDKKVVCEYTSPSPASVPPTL